MDRDLQQWAAGILGDDVLETTRIGSGASRQIWLLATGAGHYVMRVDSGDGPVAGTVLNLEREAAVYRALANTDIPMPRLIAVDPTGTALLMEHVDGNEALAAVTDDDARRLIGADYLHWLGRLHQLDVSGVDLPMPTTAAEHARLDLTMWRDIVAERTIGWATPSVTFAAEWLYDAAPSSVTSTSLCHGDAGPGNFLFVDRRVTALLDWEFTHVGDPVDDLAWVAVRNHLLGRPMDIPAVVRAWTTTTGWTADLAAVEYYRVLVLVRMAISCDASLAWRNGVEDDGIRTQVLLRPWLGAAIPTAMAFAGCDDPSLKRVTDDAEEALQSSPYASLLQLIPPLEPLVLT